MIQATNRCHESVTGAAKPRREEMAAGIAENTTISFAGSSCESTALACLHFSWRGGRQGQRHQQTIGWFQCRMWLRRKVVIIMDEVDGMGLVPR